MDPGLRRDDGILNFVVTANSSKPSITISGRHCARLCIDAVKAVRYFLRSCPSCFCTAIL